MRIEDYGMMIKEWWLRNNDDAPTEEWVLRIILDWGLRNHYYGLTIEDWGLRNGDIGLRIADWSLNIVNGGVRIEDQCLMIRDRLFMFKFWG